MVVNKTTLTGKIQTNVALIKFLLINSFPPLSDIRTTNIEVYFH